MQLCHPLWQENAEKLLAWYCIEVPCRCHSTFSTVFGFLFSRSSNKVPLRSLSRSLNDLALVDDIFLDDVKIFHTMYRSTCYSVAMVVPDMSLETALLAFESTYISPFWPLIQVQGVKGVTGNCFQTYLSSHDIQSRPAPSNLNH